ncbi:hypothetical protein [Burkholderia thailandensis]|uniref:hypothetical protein n=1 Tax=Burkholderia thailandensis TaxID=57975 RepID=UPI00107EDB4C|nr:hypothetical protein [Burkholderia thailandensis]TGB34815.1 hypothetical protein C6946_04325 [Burkholderia thailandensis]
MTGNETNSSYVSDPMVTGWRTVAYGGIVALLAGLTVYAHAKSCDGIRDIRPWIELLNGATWPDSPGELCASSAWWFSFVVALRTILNLGTVLASFVVVVELVIFRRKKIMNVRQLLESREGAVLQAIAVALNLQTTEERERMITAATAAAKHWDEQYLVGILGSSAARALLERKIPGDRGTGDRP